MKALTLFIFTIALFLIPGPGAHGAYRHFVFESPSDFEYYGFICAQDDAVVPCNIKQVENGADLPPYFPATWHSLPGPLMYIESTLERFYFRLETRTALPGDIVSFNGEYYAESDDMIGCLNVTNGSPSHPWPPTPSTDPPRWYTHKWLYVPRPKLDKIGFFMYNDKATNLTVFRRLELVIDEEPNIHLRIENVEDAMRHGMECVSGDEDSYSFTKNAGCELKSVAEGSYLPLYFNDSSRNLTLPEGNVIMYVESSDYDNHKLLFTLPTEFTQHPIGVLNLRSIYYTETEDAIGYGPILDDAPDSKSPQLIAGAGGQWISYDTSMTPGHWAYSRSYEFQPISNMIISPNSKIGFFIKNNKEYKYAVFARLEILAWFTYDSVICDPENPDPSSPTSTSSSLTGSTSGDWISTTDPMTMSTKPPTAGRSTCPTPTTTPRPSTTTTTPTTSTTRTPTTTTTPIPTTQVAASSSYSSDPEHTTESTLITSVETSQTRDYSTSSTVSTTPNPTTTTSTTSTETSQTNDPTISTDSPTTTIRSTCPTQTTTITTCRSTPGTVDSTVSSEPEPTTLNQESTTEVFAEQSTPDATGTTTTLTTTTTLPSTTTIASTTITSDAPETTTPESSAGIRVGINHYWMPVVVPIIAPVFFALSTL